MLGVTVGLMGLAAVGKFEDCCFLQTALLNRFPVMVVIYSVPWHILEG